MNLRSVVTELVRKECESYQLIDLGFLSSVEEGGNRLWSAIETADPAVLDDVSCFRNWRQEVLRVFYRQLDYAALIRNAGGKRDSFRRFWFGKKKRIVATLHRQTEEPTIDRDLAVPGKTLAFKLSVMLDKELFPEAQSAVTADTPAQLEEMYWKCCRAFFPIDMEKLQVRLKTNDDEFWEELFCTVKRIAQLVTSGQFVSIQYRKEVLQDVWTDTSLLLNQKVAVGDIPDFESALHFRNYIARMCLNKCREAVRKYHLPDVALTVIEELVGDAAWLEEETGADVLWKGGLDDIDCSNKDEVNRYFILVLWDKAEPWYSILTQGLEEKMELIFLHYVEGLSYEEIARMRDVEGTVEARKRLADKLRQDVSRSRKLLKYRFVELLKRR